MTKAKDGAKDTGKDGAATSPAAAVEAEATGDADQPLMIEFRGEQFTIDRNIVVSARVSLAIARRDYAAMLAELVEPSEYDRWLALIKRGELIGNVAAEYFRAVNATLGLARDSEGENGGEPEGNESSASRSS